MEQPYLRIVRGDASAEEVAALVIALATRDSRPQRTAQKPDTWRNPTHQMRTGLLRGPGAWRTSSLPQ
ncbi:acyl-CoA carboxylase subunit epsilon [Sphaerisporangium sp. TRM90804]|uniref:acyl-CoA carboxylase subunit epsilon n=1 Tax=Sphaerisporangium sp. TRM90804 TaxID=3031113 RepID=UPI0024495CAC|nr:acyl-CoA carboxylase subunit epsilon [Sphaerisporangium sp. TRM90804]MDH2423963.1 acyl-CoA carboxylase subunit epsilon [Sphaerisporangium sp. TRM90804]